VHRGGHALHTALAAELLRQTDAWQFVEGAVPAMVPSRVRGRVTATQSASQ
jgi:UDP-3-O-acyl-N-acetylglucosamine deacetylase